MIPKVIHYCWFGSSPLPELAVKCIESWKKYCPDYEIREWNESNYDLHCCHYVEEAYQAKKWAFVSDYARFDILYRYGGLYFDTDVELIRPIDDIVAKGSFMGCEPKHCGVSVKGAEVSIAPGLGLAAEPGLCVYKEILAYYQSLHFIHHDGSMDCETVVTKVTSVLKKYGFKEENKLQNINGIYIYTSDYFCPMDYETGKINITGNTYSIHHYSASWMPEEEVRAHATRVKMMKKYGRKKGLIIAKLLNIPIRFQYHARTKGLMGTVKFIFGKMTRKVRSKGKI